MKKSWLNLAVSKDDARTPLQSPHGCVAADGFRMHIENNAPRCACGNTEIHKGFDRVIGMAKDAPFAFAVNLEYLIDALSGINPDGKVVLFFVDPTKNGISPIVLQDPDGERTAIVMPTHIPEAQKIKNLPKVTTKKQKQVQS